MLLNKADLPLVAMDFMNDVHFEDVELINELHKKIVKFKENTSTKEDVIQIYEKWYAHTVEHFKGEEEEMLRLHFPPYMMHKSEHDNCLHIMRKVIEDFKNSEDIDKLQNYIEVDLVNWLIPHIQSMDTVTAMFFKTGLSPCSLH